MKWVSKKWKERKSNFNRKLKKKNYGTVDMTWGQDPLSNLPNKGNWTNLNDNLIINLINNNYLGHHDRNVTWDKACFYNNDNWKKNYH